MFALSACQGAATVGNLIRVAYLGYQAATAKNIIYNSLDYVSLTHFLRSLCPKWYEFMMYVNFMNTQYLNGSCNGGVFFFLFLFS